MDDLLMSVGYQIVRQETDPLMTVTYYDLCLLW
jgi:hypothetical protein